MSFIAPNLMHKKIPDRTQIPILGSPTDILHCILIILYDLVYKIFMLFMSFSVRKIIFRILKYESILNTLNAFLMGDNVSEGFSCMQIVCSTLTI